MRTPALLLGLLVTVSASTALGQAPAGESLPLDRGQRPAPSALRLAPNDLLARFAPEVRSSRKLRERALALWQTHFAAGAADIVQRFGSDEDWRPALAQAAALIDEFLEASLLPRAGVVPAGEGSADESVWIETLDPRTEQRVRVLRPAPVRPVLFAPEDKEKGAEPKEPRTPTLKRRGPWDAPLLLD